MSALVEPHEIHRVSIEEYHQMVGSGGYSDTTRVELIDGWVVDMSPRSPEHENAVRWLISWLRRELDVDHFDFLITGSLTLGDSEPEPDVTILDRVPYTRSHPTGARLVIEVALSSLDRDLRAKPRVYAPYVEEYWVIDLQAQQVVTHRHASEGEYQEVSVSPRGANPAPQSVPLPALDSDALFTAAFAE